MQFLSERLISGKLLLKKKFTLHCCCRKESAVIGESYRVRWCALAVKTSEPRVGRMNADHSFRGNRTWNCVWKTAAAALRLMPSGVKDCTEATSIVP